MTLWNQLRKSKLTENPTWHCGGVQVRSSCKYDHSDVTWRHMRWTLCHREYRRTQHLLSSTTKRPHRNSSWHCEDIAWCSFCRRKNCPCSESIIHIVSCAWRTGEERVNKREQAWLNSSLAFGILQVQKSVSIKWNIGKWNEVSAETGRETES